MSAQRIRTADPERVRRSDSGPTSASGRTPPIDLIKAVAMIGVIAQHSLASLSAVGASFWIFQAMPVLVVLFGVNMKTSLDRRRAAGLSWYLRSQLRRRRERLLIPFVVIWVVAYALGRWSGGGSRRGAGTAGALPVPASGNYFIPMIIGLTLLLVRVLPAESSHPCGLL